MNQRDRVAGFGSVAGFNTLSKMFYLFDTIKGNEAKLCVEIGVFGGRTLIPMALACLETGGRVVGIDPWSVAEAVQPEISFRTDNIDYDKLYADLVALLGKEGLTNVQLVREVSSSAVVRFQNGSIDFLHIDGNHSRDKVYQDAVGYLPKVKIGGIVVVDDISMKTVEPALDYVRERCELIREDKVGGRDDMTFVKRRGDVA